MIQSTNFQDSPANIEDKLEKAMSAVITQRERKELNDEFLRSQKSQADTIVSLVFHNMVQDIEKIL